ncbi:MAG: hypothetical protein HYY31_00360 [Chloroflexi bacterium]|nr:hypothetical protein [Chloroflexota bacterium]
MLYFRSCPKCRGAMLLQDDSFGLYKQCVNCGFIVDLEKRQLRKPTRAPKRVA